MNFYDRLVETMMMHFSKGAYENEVISAKEQFFKTVGVQNEESSEIELKMTQFSDWYLLAHQLIKDKKTPIQVLLEGKAYPIPAEEKAYYEALGSNRHSLFELLKAKDGEMVVKDLFANEKLTVKHPSATGFSKDEIFEARLIPYENSFFFGASFVFHPPQVRAFIAKEIKKVRKLPEGEQADAKEQLIQRLFKMRHKFDQYRHVGLNEIYSNDSKLRM